MCSGSSEATVPFIRAIAGLLAVVLAGAPGRVAAQPSAYSAAPDIMSELRAAGVLSAARKVGRAALVCHLSVGGRSYPVIDLQEDIAALGGGPTRAWHRVIVLRPNGGEASELTYFPPARPLTCSRNVLVFSAPVEVENTLPEGRRVAFDAGAAHAAVVEER